MSKINSSFAVEKPNLPIIDQVFFAKLHKIKKYLSQKIGHGEEHDNLIQDLDCLRSEITNYQLRVSIIGRRFKLLEKIKLAKQDSSFLKDIAQFETVLFPGNLDRLFRNCDLIFLVIDSSKDIIPIEKNSIVKSQAIKIPLIIIDFNDLEHDIYNWIKDDDLPDFNSLRYFSFHQDLLQSNQLSIFDKEYHDSLKASVEQAIQKIELSLEDRLSKVVDRYFMQCKSKYWEDIKQHKQNYFAGETASQFQDRVRQLPQKFHKKLQHSFRGIRQTLQDSKPDLINPFIPTSFIFSVQQIINQSIVIESQEDQKIYLNLVISGNIPRQAIHSHILDLFQHRIDSWIEQQWQTLHQESNIFNQLIEDSDLELAILHNLSDEKLKLEAVPQPIFDLNKYICPMTVSEISRTIFDYHYSQSSWFRIVIAIAAGAVFFIFTGRLFGFIFLVIQVINFITGQSPKSLKLKQQTKEIKKTADTKYQALVRFVADKLMQDISFFLDHQHQLYQDQVNSYIQNANRNLVKIKQKIVFNQNKLSELNKDQEALKQIIKG